jgi:hypothetical protein
MNTDKHREPERLLAGRQPLAAAIMHCGFLPPPASNRIVRKDHNRPNPGQWRSIDILASTAKVRRWEECSIGNCFGSEF